MAISRKAALERLNGFAQQIELHLTKLASESTGQPSLHWRGEVRQFIDEMERMLPHVGRRTASEWKSRIDAYKRTLGK
jgi:hypothetical protein